MVSHTKEEANSESCLSELPDYNVHASQDGAAHRTASTLRLGSRMSGMEMHCLLCASHERDVKVRTCPESWPRAGL